MLTNSETGYTVPLNLATKLFLNIVCEVHNNEIVIQQGEIVNDFYMIKKGRVRLFDIKYNYLYDLEQQSYFGEYNILFGLTSNISYRFSGNEVDSNCVQNILFKINSKEFMTIIT